MGMVLVILALLHRGSMAAVVLFFLVRGIQRVLPMDVRLRSCHRIHLMDTTMVNSCHRSSVLLNLYPAV